MDVLIDTVQCLVNDTNTCIPCYQHILEFPSAACISTYVSSVVDFNLAFAHVQVCIATVYTVRLSLHL